MGPPLYHLLSPFSLTSLCWGPYLKVSSFLAVDIAFICHQHWLTHALAGLKHTMTSSGCRIVFVVNWVVYLYGVIASIFPNSYASFVSIFFPIDGEVFIIRQRDKFEIMRLRILYCYGHKRNSV